MIAWWPTKKYLGMNADTDVFKAFRGWLEKFKKKCGIYWVAKHGEGGSVKEDASEKCVQEFSDYM